MEKFNTQQHDIKLEIAMAAARLVAEEGYDYASAKQKARKQIASDIRLPAEAIPSDLDIQEEVRAYQALYQPHTQPSEQRELRLVAVSLLEALEEFEPIVYGALVNGTGNKHSDIHVIAFSDNPKEIDYWLLNRDIEFRPCEDALLAGKCFPAVAIQWERKWVQLASSEAIHRRGLLKKGRKDAQLFQTDLSGLRQLIEQDQTEQNQISGSNSHE